MPFLLAGWVACAGCTAAPEAPQAPPRLVVEETTHDAGRITQGTTIRHHFTIRNDGERALRLSGVRPSCDCAAEIVTRDAIARGATGTLAVEVATDDLAGTIERSFTVFSNDPEHPSQRLTLRADVVADVVIEPRQLYVGPVARGARATASARISFPRLPAARALAAKPMGRIAHPRWLDAGSTGVRRMTVEIADDAPPGPFHERVRIRTSHPERAVVELVVAGVVVEKGEVE